MAAPLLQAVPWPQGDPLLTGVSVLSQAIHRPPPQPQQQQAATWELVNLGATSCAVVSHHRHAFARLDRSFKSDEALERLLQLFWQGPSAALAQELQAKHAVVAAFRPDATLVTLEQLGHSGSTPGASTTLLVWSDGQLHALTRAPATEAKRPAAAPEPTPATVTLQCLPLATGTGHPAMAVVAAAYHVERSLLVWCHTLGSSATGSSHRISLRRLLHHSNGLLELLTAQVIMTQLPDDRHVRLLAAKESVHILISQRSSLPSEQPPAPTPPDSGLPAATPSDATASPLVLWSPWLLTWRLASNRLRAALLDGGSLPVVPQVDPSRLASAVDMVPCYDFRAARAAALELLATAGRPPPAEDAGLRAPVVAVQASADSSGEPRILLLRSDGRLQLLADRDVRTLVTLQAALPSETFCLEARLPPYVLLASDTGEIRIFDATGGKLLQSSSLPARPSVPTACFCTRSEEASSLALALPGFGAVALILSTAAQQADALRAAEMPLEAAQRLRDPMARGAFYCSLLSELKADQDMATALMALKAIEPLCQSPALAVALLGHDWGFWSALLQHLQSHRNHATALSEALKDPVETTKNGLAHARELLLGHPTSTRVEALLPHSKRSAGEEDAAERSRLWRVLGKLPMELLETCLQRLQCDLRAGGSDTKPPATTTVLAQELFIFEIAAVLLLRLEPTRLEAFLRWAAVRPWKPAPPRAQALEWLSERVSIAVQASLSADWSEAQARAFVRLLQLAGGMDVPLRVLYSWLRCGQLGEACKHVQRHAQDSTLFVVLLRHLYAHGGLDEHVDQVVALLPKTMQPQHLTHLLGKFERECKGQAVGAQAATWRELLRELHARRPKTT